MRRERRQEDWSALAPALGIVVGSAVLVTLVVALSGTVGHIAFAIAGGAAGGLLVAPEVQLWRRI